MSLRFKLAKKHAQHYLNLLNEINIQYVIGGDSIQPSIATFDRSWRRFRRRKRGQQHTMKRTTMQLST